MPNSLSGHDQLFGIPRVREPWTNTSHPYHGQTFSRNSMPGQRNGINPYFRIQPAINKQLNIEILKYFKGDVDLSIFYNPPHYTSSKNDLPAPDLS